MGGGTLHIDLPKMKFKTSSSNLPSLSPSSSSNNNLNLPVSATFTGSLVRTYVFHMLRTYVLILCNWLVL